MNTMTYADLIAEALRLVHANTDEPLTARQAAALNGVGDGAAAKTIKEATAAWIRAMSEDKNYSDYVDNVWGAMDRCFTDIELRGVIPPRRVALLREGGVPYGSYLRYEIPALLPDGGKPVSVLVRRPDGESEALFADLDYFIEGDELLLPAEVDGASLVYLPQIPRVRLSDDLTACLPLTAQIASLVPYFLASELYRAEEPGEADELRAAYERGMERIARDVPGGCARVRRVMGVDFGG